MENEISKKKDKALLRNTDSQLPSVEDKHRYLHAATTDNTRRTYRSAIRHFEQWGGLLPANESMIVRYLHDHAETLNTRTLSLRLTALRQWHRLQGFTDPTESAEVRKTLKGIQRLHGQPKRKAKTFPLDDMQRMITYLDNLEGLKAVRDRALLLIGFFGAFRRSELSSLAVEHLTWEPEGLIIELPRSKTDQTGQGKIKALPYGNNTLCPVASLRHWLNESDIKSGFVFCGITRWGMLKENGLNPSSINLILKSIAEEAGLDNVPELSSHSLRRSLATNAHRSGASFESIKRQGGWTHDGTVWEYIEEARRFEDNAVTKLFQRDG